MGNTEDHDLATRLLQDHFTASAVLRVAIRSCRILVLTSATVLLAAGCVTDRRAYRNCDLPREEWTILEQPPPLAEEALSVADIKPGGWTRIVWFESKDDRVAVCDVPPPSDGVCGLQIVILRRGDDGHWQTADDGMSVTLGVCG